MVARLVRERPREMARLAAVSGSAQQHGSVYLDARGLARLTHLDAVAPLAVQMANAFSRAVSPVWMDSSTTDECREIATARRRRRRAGGAHRLARVRAIHGSADPAVLQTRTARLRRDRAHPSGLVVPRLAALRRGRADRSRRRVRHEPDGSRSRSVVASRARRHGAGPGREAASHCVRVDRRRAARAVLAGALRSAAGARRRLVGRQPVQPHRHRPRARRHHRRSRSARATRSSG